MELYAHRVVNLGAWISQESEVFKYWRLREAPRVTAVCAVRRYPSVLLVVHRISQSGQKKIMIFLTQFRWVQMYPSEQNVLRS
eukprot:SAG11_NODE_1239_length_5424_cov_8.855399_4_plen_83_part_00